ncbi:MAG TPA: hypothetical protein VH351_16600 [Bryobacteraceae bacterium]|jgi:predicted TIM-barrel fold metal-dependent hydrolase|nr:hypothetical protein [Bryobacteraceae bacterium]
MLKRRQVGVNLIGKSILGFMLVGAVTVVVQPAAAQEYHYNSEHRRPVEVTLRDLQQVAQHNSYNGHERERYDNAIHHLSQFAERLHERGNFDKDKLDQAIGDVQSILDHNSMHDRGRELLTRDVNDLRRLREHYDERYHYHD